MSEFWVIELEKTIRFLKQYSERKDVKNNILNIKIMFYLEEAIEIVELLIKYATKVEENGDLVDLMLFATRQASKTIKNAMNEAISIKVSSLSDLYEAVGRVLAFGDWVGELK